MIPRWIKDYNPSESVQSRIENTIYAMCNNTTVNGFEFTSERELIGWVVSELMSLLNKINAEH